jgi:hypothetical protein
MLGVDRTSRFTPMTTDAATQRVGRSPIAVYDGADEDVAEWSEGERAEPVVGRDPREARGRDLPLAGRLPERVSDHQAGPRDAGCSRDADRRRMQREQQAWSSERR